VSDGERISIIVHHWVRLRVRNFLWLSDKCGPFFAPSCIYSLKFTKFLTTNAPQERVICATLMPVPAVLELYGSKNRKIVIYHIRDPTVSSGTRQLVQTLSDVCLKRTCSLNTSVFSALEVPRSINLLTYLVTNAGFFCDRVVRVP